MAKLTEIKYKIDMLDGGPFQELCDAYLSKLGYNNIHSLGMKSGTHKTTKGIPDTYFTEIEDKYVLIMYTTQKTGNLFDKIKGDIEDCFDEKKTGLKSSDIAEIIYCHTSSNIKPGEDKILKGICTENDVALIIKGIDTIATDIYNYYPGIARDILGVSISTEQIMTVDEFISSYNANSLAAPLDTIFLHRAKEIESVADVLEQTDIVILSGQAGVGKTRLALACAENYIENHGGKFYCIRSNGLSIYEDLKVFLGVPGKYLLVIDDANQITRLQHIIQYTTKHSSGYSVKIIITVRDYAKSNVVDNIREIARYKIVPIKKFSDQEIEELMKEALGILNDAYLDKIVHIAEGNARVAMLAGKIACKANELDSIHDASQLYEEYYGNFLRDNNIFKEDDKFCASAGIIAFLNVIHLEHLSNLLPILEQINLKPEEFRKNINKLHDLEIVDICNDKAVKFSEQCLSNYLIKYVFVDKSLISFSSMIKTCFTFHKQRVINAVNVLVNVFASEKIHEEILQAVSIVWNDLEDSKDKSFFEFVKTFYRLRPVDTLLILKNKIDLEETISFNVSSIDFEKEKNQQKIDNDIINILGGFSNHEELLVALDLLFQYYQKRPDFYMQFYHTILRFFGVARDDYSYDYYTQTHLAEKFKEYADDWKNELVNHLFIHIAKALLKLVFRPSAASRASDKIIMYTIYLQITEGVKEYRRLFWEGLLNLSHNQVYRKDIEDILETYGDGHREDICHEVVQYDLQYIRLFYEKVFSAENLSDCITADKTLQRLRRLHVDYSDTFEAYIQNKDFKIYQMLKGNWPFGNCDFEEEKKIKREAIEKYTSTYNIEGIKDIFLVWSECERKNNQEIHVLAEGLSFVFEALSSKQELFINAIELYMQNDIRMNVHSYKLVQKLFDFLPEEEVYDLLNKYNYEQKNEWFFYYFCCLPHEQITGRHIQRLYDFLEKRECDMSSFNGRGLSFLDKYALVDPDVFINCCQILVKRLEDSPVIVNNYFQSLFYRHEDGTAANVVEKFKGHYGLLETIYIQVITNSNYMDYEGQFFKDFYTVHPPILTSYISYLIKNEKMGSYNSYNHQLIHLWNLDNFLEIMDTIIQYCIDNDDTEYYWTLSKYYEEILVHKENEIEIVARQDKWINHYIKNNYNKKKEMYCLFKAICAFAPERRKEHILYFITVKSDFECFKGIPLDDSTVGGWSVNMIPSMEARIDFLQSLLPHFRGIQFLNHKKRISDDIESWKRRIKQEELDAMLEG